jgi:hypothetical protein
VTEDPSVASHEQFSRDEESRTPKAFKNPSPGLRASSTLPWGNGYVMRPMFAMLFVALTPGFSQVFGVRKLGRSRLNGISIHENSTAFYALRLSRSRNRAAEQRPELSPRRICEPWVDSTVIFGAAERRLNAFMIYALRSDSINRCSAAPDKLFSRNPTLAQPRVGLNSHRCSAAG